MTRAWIVLVLAGACSHSGPAGGGGGGSNAGTGKPVDLPTTPITSCETARPKIEALYQADAEATMPGADKAQKRAELVADNTQMVLNDCAKTTATAVPCLARVTTVADLEAKCLIPLDDEGTEGDALKAMNKKKESP